MYSDLPLAYCLSLAITPQTVPLLFCALYPTDFGPWCPVPVVFTWLTPTCHLPGPFLLHTLTVCFGQPSMSFHRSDYTVFWCCVYCFPHRLSIHSFVIFLPAPFKSDCWVICSFLDSRPLKSQLVQRSVNPNPTSGAREEELLELELAWTTASQGNAGSREPMAKISGWTDRSREQACGRECCVRRHPRR